jgi:acyl-coenzyme A thioesterase PaaI-like protein
METFIQKLKFKFINFYPPFLGSGIKVESISSDFRHILVSLKLKFWNKNYVGTQFGGSLYSMCDPFLMLMIMKNLGRNYVVWDKAASIQFIRPGREKVWVEFRIEQSDINSILEKLESSPVYEPIFQLEVKNSKHEVIAKVEKKIYIRSKNYSNVLRAD